MFAAAGDVMYLSVVAKCLWAELQHNFFAPLKNFSFLKQMYVVVRHRVDARFRNIL